MIAYDKKGLDKLRIVTAARSWKKNKLICENTFEKIKGSYESGFYKPNIFVRVALFIFTLFIVGAALGLIGTLFIGSDIGEKGVAVLLIIASAAIFIILEKVFIEGKKNFCSGIDDALTYSGTGLLIGGIILLILNIATGISNEELVAYSCAFPLLALIAIRYADKILAVLAYLCAGMILFFIVYISGGIALKLLPFLVIAISAGAYFYIRKVRQKDALVYWDESLMLLEILSLFTLYLGGNYFVVRELSESLMNLQLNVGEDIPLALVFYFFTAIIPVIYIVTGLRNKDRVMFRAGLIIFALAVLTFKNYFSLGHHEISLTIAGVLLTGFSLACIRFLKVPKFGFTLKEENDTSFLNSDMESLVMVETFGKAAPAAEQGVKFGGGEFGGAGAGSEF